MEIEHRNNFAAYRVALKSNTFILLELLLDVRIFASIFLVVECFEAAGCMFCFQRLY